MFRPDNLEERPIEQPPHEIRIYEALRTVKPIFMNLLREHKQWKIDFVHPRDHNLLPPLKEYNGDPLNLTVHCASPDECLASGWDPQFWALEHETQEALLSRNQCDGFCFVFLLAVTRMLSDIQGFLEVDWVTASPLPLKVYTYDHEIGEEGVTRHDFLLITMTNGERFCLDGSGIQFGFPEVLYKKEEYLKKYVDPTLNIRKVNFEKMLKKYERIANSSESKPLEREEAHVLLRWQNRVEETHVKDLKRLGN